MAPMSTQRDSSFDSRDRRICPRQQVKSLAYLDIGADNGGIVLNISESGVAVHAVSVLPAEPLVDLRLQLPRSSKRLEAKGKVAWTSSTKKEAGVEFIDLPEEVRLEIREWLASENLEPVYFESAPNAEPPVRRPARKDKWTNLVSELTSIPAGIERVADDRTVSPRPVTVAESLSTEETAAPAPPNLNSLTTSEEPVADAPAHDLGLAESLMADQRSVASDSIAQPDLIDRSFSPNPDPIGDVQYRKADPELSLPSDKLLNTPVHPFAIVPSRGNKIDNAKASRNQRDSGSAAPDGDDFLRKARALFVPKHANAPQPEINDSALESMEAAPAELPAAVGAPEHPPAPMSDLTATSTASTEPFTPNLLRPVTSIPLDPSASRGTEAKRSSTALPLARNLDLRSFLSILALCVLLSAVCLVLGIVVGRGVAMRSPNFNATRNDISAPPSQLAEAQKNPTANQADFVPSSSPGQNRAPAQTSARAQRPQPETVPRRRTSEPRPSDSVSAPSADAADDPAENAAVDQKPARNTVAPSSAASASPTGGSATLSPPSTTAAASATGNHASPTSGTNAAPQPQPPSDRMVAAYLIYRVEPIYPRSALQLGMEGTVKIHATVGRDGTVKNLKVVSGPSLLTSAAMDAAQYWRYIPALHNGEPVETDTDISIEFHKPR
jgi:TonB family protein